MAGVAHQAIQIFQIRAALRQQADVQAQLMGEAFGLYADNLFTKDHFTAVLDARFGEQRALFEQRFVEQDAKFEKRFAGMERTQSLHTWMLGLITLVLVLPQLQAWLV